MTAAERPQPEQVLAIIGQLMRVIRELKAEHDHVNRQA